MAINVFLSVGRIFNPQQEKFVSSIESFLVESGLRPRTVGRNEFTHKKPLELIDELVDRSAGALVIALERIVIGNGAECGGPPDGTEITNETLCTPWNQIEAAFAYAKRRPLLVIKQDKVRGEGLLEGRYDWYVHSTGLDSSFLESVAFRGTFDSWHRDIRKRAGWFKYRG